MSKLFDELHNICQFISYVWVGLAFVDFAEFDVYINAETSFQIRLYVRHLVFHSVVRVRLRLLHFEEVFELVNALLRVWLQSPLFCESCVLLDISIRFSLTLRLLSPVLILFELCLRRNQVRRQLFVLYFFEGTQ